MDGTKQELFMNKNIRQKFIISAALMIAATASVFAQGNGLAGINEATSMVSSYFDPGTKLIYAIGAVPRHEQDSRLMVRGLYLPDCRCDYPALILPLINNVWLNTR